MAAGKRLANKDVEFGIFAPTHFIFLLIIGSISRYMRNAERKTPASRYRCMMCQAFNMQCQS